jgi:hypothetical protein
MRRSAAIIGAFLFLFAVATALAQETSPYPILGVNNVPPPFDLGAFANGAGLPEPALVPALTAPAPSVAMSPELALNTYLKLASRQLTDLGAYSDETTIEADLPDTSQHGRYELRRSFQAPKTLAYAAKRFVGDGFVKTNVIIRLLQSEVDHVQKGEGQLTAITAANYKFSWKGVDTLEGRTYYRYQVKPRQKRPGLFKGFILVDAANGQLRRAEGTMVKPPSIFVKKIEFLQEYGECGPFSLPVHLHSVAKTRLVGRAIVDVEHSGYAAKTLAEVQSQAASSSAAGASTN